MNTLHFSIHVKAAPGKVWQILWDDTTYRQWAATFYEGSYAKSDWNESSKIYFLGPGGEGMVSMIQEKKEPHKMVFRHIGMMKNFEELPSSEKTREWEGALESYILTAQDDGTLLEVMLDSEDNSADYFKDTFPKALEKIKALSEAY